MKAKAKKMTLIEALRKHPHSTAKKLASLMGVSIPTVYRMVVAANAAGALIAEVKVRRAGKTGPTPVQFVLVLPFDMER